MLESMSCLQTLTSSFPIHPLDETRFGSQSLRFTLEATPQDHLSKDIFPSLPPLFSGHSDVHLRNGIMNASSLADNEDRNAERAFFVADLGVVYGQHQRWKKHLPYIQPFYAVKCNPDPYVIRLLAALGTGFDCASSSEIERILALGGIPPSRIIFANPCKPLSFIRNAASAGVDLMTFDNADELHKIARIYPSARLVIRILTDDSESLVKLGMKFGAHLEAVPGLLATAKRLGLNVVGVSFHVGSGCLNPNVYRTAIKRSSVAFEMGRRAGFHFSLLDVGGGFEDALFERAASILTDAIEDYFPDREGIDFIAEPGRFLVATAFRLATNIIARRAPTSESAIEEAKKGSDDDPPAVMYYINDGLYGSFNCILFDHQVVHPYALSVDGSFHFPSSQPVCRASVWGPTCDGLDCVCPSAELPSGLRVGDWLGFDNMGAYTVCAASQFNGFELSTVTYTTGGKASNEVREALLRFAAAGYGA